MSGYIQVIHSDKTQYARNYLVSYCSAEMKRGSHNIMAHIQLDSTSLLNEYTYLISDHSRDQYKLAV